MKIAVDVMGGDYAPEEIIKGTVIAAKEYDTDIVLVGPVKKIETELATQDKPNANIKIIAANEYLAEGEHPGQ